MKETLVRYLWTLIVKAKNNQHYDNSASKEKYTGKVSTDSDSEGPLSITFTIYTQNFVPTYARGGPASHFSQFSELCVATSIYLFIRVSDYPTYTYRILVCVDFTLIWIYEYPDSLVSVTILVCVDFTLIWIYEYPDSLVSVTILVCVDFPTWGFRTPHQGR